MRLQPVLDTVRQVDTKDGESGNSQKKALQRFIFPQGSLHCCRWRRDRLRVQHRTIMHNEEKYPNMLMRLTDIDWPNTRLRLCMYVCTRLLFHLMMTIMRFPGWPHSRITSKDYKIKIWRKLVRKVFMEHAHWKKIVFFFFLSKPRKRLTWMITAPVSR